MTRLLRGAFFVSGLSSLAFETLWFDRAALALGCSVWATSLVLSAFMAGLGLGGLLIARAADRIEHPLRLYAAAEVVVAVFGVGLVLELPHLGPALASVLGPLADQPVALNPARLLVAFVLLLVPSTAMGTTLPLLTTALSRTDPVFGRVLGGLYGTNTLGAVAGAVLTETVLLGALGVTGAALSAAALAAAAAVVALLVSRRAVTPRSASKDAGAARAPAALPPWRWLVAALLAGLNLLALEVVWFRFLLLFVSAESASFAFMVASVLLGIAAGGLAGSVLSARVAGTERYAASIALAAGAVCMATYALFSPGPPPPLTAPADPVRVVRMAVTLALPTAFLSGMLFTSIGSGIRAAVRSDATATGALASANTLGAAAGSLLGGLVLLPLVGVEISIFVLAVSYGAIALLVRGSAPRWSLTSAAGAVVIAALLFPFGAMSERHLLFPLSRWESPETVGRIWVREGVNETSMLVERRFLGQREALDLLTQSFAMSGTDSLARRYMKAYVYLPVALHPKVRRALLVCYGVGSTAKALTDTRALRRIDVVDTSREVLGLSRIVFPRGNPLRDPRVRVHVEDGRWFLMATRQRYDLITAEPPPPNVASVVYLYTREYFELLRSRLAPGGMATYWLPMHGLSDRSARSILGAFCGAFADCSLWHGSGPNLMMLGTRGAGRRPSEESFTRQWNDPVVAPEMSDLGFDRPEQLGALFVGDGAFLADLTRGARPLVDDAPKVIMAPETAAGATDRLARSWLDPGAAASRFARSAFIERLWPERLREGSLDLFDLQYVIQSAIMRTRLQEPHPWPALHVVLTRSSARLPVLLLLGSVPERQHISAAVAARAGDDPVVQMELAIAHMADRRYLEAARACEHAQRAPPLRARALALRVYALLLASKPAEAERALSTSGDALGTDPEQVAFLGWLRETFGFDP